MKRSTALLFALGLILLMAVNGADFFFHQPYYEYWDTAANSLSVIQAKHFAEMYGNYSRWLFHHPGPAFFYVDAFGEWLFYDALHVVPTPYNGQVLINLCLMVGFFMTALRVFTLWLPRRQWGGFLFVALGAAILHFGSMSVRLPAYDILRGSPAFLSTWPGHVLVLPLLCLLAVGASVAAGRGGDLPLLALVDGFLVHGHISQPLFVVPLSLLAYAGLLGHCAWRERGAATPGSALLPPWRRAVRWLGAAWRAHRGAHLGALALALFFALPVILDAFRGHDSNLAAIYGHLLSHRHDPHKSLGRSLLYFLQFGAYTAYRPDLLYFGPFDAAGAWEYLRGHALVYAVWLAAAALACWAAVAQAWSLWQRAPVVADPAALPTDADRRRFLAWAAVFLAAAVVLTLYWGMKQDGVMFFYNAVFNFGIYYFAALLAAAVLAGWPWLGWVTGGGGWQGRPRVRAGVAVGLLALLGLGWADRFRVSDSSPETTRAMQASVARVLAATAPAAGRAPALAVFDFPTEAWPTVIGLALQMKRAGRPFAVRDLWSISFHRSNSLGLLPKQELVDSRVWHCVQLPTFVPWDSAAGPLAQEQAVWRAELENARAHPTPGSFQLLNGVVLTLPMSTLDPGAGAAEIRFTPGGNAPEFAVTGWGDAEGFGRWSTDRMAVMRFRPVAVTGEAVELTLDAVPFLVPEHGLKVQRLRVLFDGAALGPEQRYEPGGPPSRVFTIPAARWNRAAAPDGPGASLAFELPDATSPASLAHSTQGDVRPLGLGFQALRFRVVPAPASTPQP